MPINKEYVPIDNKPTIKPRTVTGIFTRYIAKTLPLAFDESMSYYECLCALLEYINTKVIPALDNNAAGLLELQEFYEELQTYVNDYFKNLDVQEEINNKLDEMAESGQLTDIIAQYLGLAGMIAYDTVADMKLATNLVNGSKCCTLGYHSVNDGGKAVYKIRTITNDDRIDEGSIIELYDNSLIAELVITNDTVNVYQFGAKGDNLTDDTEKLENAINFSENKKLLLGNGNFIISSPLEITNLKLIGNNSTIKASSDFNGNYMILPHQDIKLENIKFNANNKVISIIGESSNNTNLKLTNCEFTNVKRDSSVDNFALNSAVYITAKNVEVINCNIHDNLSHGLRLKTNYNDTSVLIDNCKFINNGSKTSTITYAHGIFQGGGEEGTKYNKVNIINCFAYNNGSSGIAPHSCNNITISNCVSSNNGEHGIVIMDGKNAVISNCICKNNVSYGVRIQGDYTTSDIYNGYKNAIVSNCYLTPKGLDIGENINNIKISNNLIEYGTSLNQETSKGIRIGKTDYPLNYVKNCIITDNNFKGYDYTNAIVSFIDLDNTNTFDNYINGVRNKNYFIASPYFQTNTSSYYKYGETNNILDNPTDFSQSTWGKSGGASVSNNVITVGSTNMILFTQKAITTPPRFICVTANFENYTEGASFSLGLRFRNSSNTLIGSEYQALVKPQGKYMTRIFDVSTMANLTPSEIAKVDVCIYVKDTSTIKINYCYCSLSNDPTILPNVM